MRATRWSLLVAASALVAACSSGSVEVTMPEPPPVTAAAVAEPEVAPEVVESTTTLPPAPVTEAPAPAVVDDAAAEEDDPIPIGAAPRRAAPRAAGPAPVGVRAAQASPSNKPQPTGRIEIPAIGLNHLTYEGIDLAIINYGPSHWPGTPLPGHRGNTVFPGHRTTYSRPFWDLDKLVPGNQVIFTTPAGRFTYVVQRTFIVDARDTWVVNNTPDATFTLLACHPKGSAKQRIVVKGTLVGPPVEARAAAPAQPGPTTPTTRQKFLGIL